MRRKPIGSNKSPAARQAHSSTGCTDGPLAGQLRKTGHRVHPHTVENDLQMQVRAGHKACASHRCNSLPLRDRLPLRAQRCKRCWYSVWTLPSWRDNDIIAPQTVVAVRTTWPDCAAATGVPSAAAMSTPAWKSSAPFTGLSRKPYPEVTGPATGSRSSCGSV